MTLSYGEMSPAKLGRITTFALVGLLIAVTGIGGWSLINTAKAKNSEAAILALNNQVRESQASIRQVKQVLATGTSIVGPSGKPIVVEFQSAIEHAARKNEVTVEFTQVGDPNIFISRFKNEQDSTLKQIELQMTLGGNISDVVRTLDQFADLRMPFEFGAMDIGRDTTVLGAGKIIARTTVYVLIPSNKS